MLRKALLVCGVLSSLLYVGADLLAAVRYPGYHSFTSQAISELTAVGAPTKGLVEPLFIAYDILIFGTWTGFEAARLAAQQPTPWLGVAERIHVGAYLLWVLVLAVALLRSGATSHLRRGAGWARLT